MLKPKWMAGGALAAILMCAMAPEARAHHDFSIDAKGDVAQAVTSNPRDPERPVRRPTLEEQLSTALVVQTQLCGAWMGYECDAAKGDVARLRAAIAARAAGVPPATRAEAEQVAWEVMATVRMPDPVVSVGPAPSLNEWNMAVVGYPLWFWTSESGHEAATSSGYGVTVSIDAVRESTVFDFGDGTSLTCRGMTPYSAEVATMAESPDCGHVYQRPSLPAGSYTVTATARWRISWRVGGFSGVEMRTFSQSAALRVGELQSVRVG